MTGADGAVAVVVPVRDGAGYLREALDSAAAQQPPPGEVIVVDDGSTDASARLALAWGARVLRSPAAGPGATRNHGARSAESDVVAFLDADDRMLPGRLAAQTAALRADPALLGVVGMVRSFRDGGDGQGPVVEGWIPSALTVRREEFLATGGFPEDLPAGEFVDWLARCRAEGRRVALLPTLVAERRSHRSNLTRDRQAVARGYLEVARRAVDRHRRHGAFGA